MTTAVPSHGLFPSVLAAAGAAQMRKTDLVNGFIVYSAKFFLRLSGDVCERSLKMSSRSVISSTGSCSPMAHFLISQAVSRTPRKPRATPEPIGQNGYKKINRFSTCFLTVGQRLLRSKSRSSTDTAKAGHPISIHIFDWRKHSTVLSCANKRLI